MPAAGSVGQLALHDGADDLVQLSRVRQSVVAGVFRVHECVDLGVERLLVFAVHHL